MTDRAQIYQIVQILNAHLNSLQWIDQSSTALQLKIAEVDKQLKASKLEHDKITRMRKSSTYTCVYLMVARGYF